MNRLKAWLMDQFLPAYCRDEMLAYNKALRQEAMDLKRENERLRAYIGGLETAMRNQRRIVVRNEVKQD